MTTHATMKGKGSPEYNIEILLEEIKKLRRIKRLCKDAGQTDLVEYIQFHLEDCVLDLEILASYSQTVRRDCPTNIPKSSMAITNQMEESLHEEVKSPIKNTTTQMGSSHKEACQFTLEKRINQLEEAMNKQMLLFSKFQKQALGLDHSQETVDKGIESDSDSIPGCIEKTLVVNLQDGTHEERPSKFATEAFSSSIKQSVLSEMYHGIPPEVPSESVISPNSLSRGSATPIELSACSISSMGQQGAVDKVIESGSNPENHISKNLNDGKMKEMSSKPRVPVVLNRSSKAIDCSECITPSMLSANSTLPRESAVTPTESSACSIPSVGQQVNTSKNETIFSRELSIPEYPRYFCWHAENTLGWQNGQNTPGWQSVQNTTPGWQGVQHTTPWWQSVQHTTPGWQSAQHTTPGWQSAKNNSGWQSAKNNSGWQSAVPDSYVPQSFQDADRLPSVHAFQMPLDFQDPVKSVFSSFS